MTTISERQLIVMMVLALLALACDEGEAIRVTEAKTTALVQTGSALAPELDRVLPEWNDSIKTAPDSAAKGLVIGTAPIDAVSRIDALDKTLFAYAETRGNGDVVYKTAKKDKTVKWNDKKGMWKLLSDDNFNKLKSTKKVYDFSDAVAQKNTDDLFTSFGIADDERGETNVIGIGIADEGATKGTRMATLVTIPRRINGISVNSSYFRASYNIDGSLFRAEVRWPVFTLDEKAEIIDRKTAIEEIATKLDQGGREVTDLSAFMAYDWDEETGNHDPTIRVIFTDKATGSRSGSVRYSLTKGIWDPGVDSTLDDLQLGDE